MEFFWLVPVFMIIFLVGAYFDADNYVIAFICVFAFLGFITLRHNGFFDEEVRKQRQAEVIKETTPELRTQDMGNGCTMNYWFAQGPKNGFTKFVRCKDSKTVTFETYSCGTSKAPKTCTREVETK